MIEHPRAFVASLAVTIICLALFVMMIVFTVLAPAPVPDAGAFGLGGPLGSVLMFTPLLSFVFVGGLLAARRPRNAVGWICLASGACWTLTFFSDPYRAYGLQTHGRPPPLSDWINLIGWVPAVGLLGTFLLLLFPTGHLPSRRWRPVAWLAGGVIAVLHVAITFGPSDPSGTMLDVPDAFHVLRPAAMALSPLIVLLPLSILVSVASLVARYRRAGVVEREQIRWIVYAGMIVALTYGVTVPASLVFDGPGGSVPVPVGILQTLTLMSFATVPIAVGVAVMRFRLFAIDRLISRTLAYSIVTMLLGCAFAVVLILPSSVLKLRSDPLVALATLVVAVLFRPLRTRVQGWVDRRFHRARYDAEVAIASFMARQREQVDVDALIAGLCDAVEQAMKPEHVSVWMLPGRGSRKGSIE